MVSAFANMVHHPGPLLDQMTQRMLPKLDTMDAGAPCTISTDVSLHGNVRDACYHRVHIDERFGISGLSFNASQLRKALHCSISYYHSHENCAGLPTAANPKLLAHCYFSPEAEGGGRAARTS